MFICRKGPSWLIHILESGFYKWGVTVATHPWTVIAISVLLTFVCSLGLVNFDKETDPNKFIAKMYYVLYYNEVYK